MSDSDTNIDTDYEFSRDTYYSLIKAGVNAIDNMANVANDTEHPRAYEVLGNMIKQIADVNDKLMDHNKKKRDIRLRNTGPLALPPPSGATTNVFVGSTTELQRFLLLQQQQSDNNIIDITAYREERRDD